MTLLEGNADVKGTLKLPDKIKFDLVSRYYEISIINTNFYDVIELSVTFIFKNIGFFSCCDAAT